MSCFLIDKLCFTDFLLNSTQKRKDFTEAIFHRQINQECVILNDAAGHFTEAIFLESPFLDRKNVQAQQINPSPHIAQSNEKEWLQKIKMISTFGKSFLTDAEAILQAETTSIKDV
jgi:hypothetical protein